jgi:hypothetical protein
MTARLLLVFALLLVACEVCFYFLRKDGVAAMEV